MKIKTTISENNNPKKAEGTEAEGRRAKGGPPVPVFKIRRWTFDVHSLLACTASS